VVTGGGVFLPVSVWRTVIVTHRLLVSVVTLILWWVLQHWERVALRQRVVSVNMLRRASPVSLVVIKIVVSLIHVSESSAPSLLHRDVTGQIHA
jgi:hypothetical protein